ncbi:MAG: SUMF1/EgtB/PvdO family nonheme iron enzyme [Bacteroidota bacterium]|nr:SUMF1/EgtB/PvdO family nonheme iron enzyme [Bacteroidota bacterium]
MKIYILLSLGLLFFCFSTPKPYKKAKKQHWMYVKDSLLMSAYEMSNGEYNAYLKDLKSQNQLTAYKIAMPDTNVWANDPKLKFNQPFVKFYFQHPGYSDYPLVGVTHQQAIAYCDWLTQKTNKDPKRVFKKVWVRLPTQAEWKYAAGAGNPNRNYPWQGEFLRNSKGMFLANYKTIGDENLAVDSNGNVVVSKCKTIVKTTIDHKTDTTYYNYHDCASGYGSFITVRLKSYFPNELGLYNMAGNVSELLADNKQYIGGDWSSIAYYLKLNTPTRTLNKSLSTVGFRYVIEVLEF